MKIKDECVFSALEGRSRRMVVVERHGKWRVFNETARSSGCGACSPQRHRQCPILRQRQGATAAARRDEGVTLRPRLYGRGRPDAGPLPFDLPASVSRFGLSARAAGRGAPANSPILPLDSAEAPASSYRNISDLFRINAAISGWQFCRAGQQDRTLAWAMMVRGQKEPRFIRSPVPSTG
jgi:hypothetical protein